MNRKLLALAVTAALAAPMAAQAAPTVYGQLNLSVDLVDWDDGVDDDREVQVNSNSSRLGVKGEEALGNGYSAVYKAEWAVAGDVADADESDLTGRDRYLGLKGNWGTVKLGAYDSPFKTSQGMVDQFNDMNYADMGNYITGENRLNNLIGYESPVIADVLTVNVALQSGEETGTGDDDAASASVVYQANGLYLAGAIDNDVIDGNVSDIMGVVFGVGADEPFARDAFRVTGVYTMDNLQLGALIQISEFNDDKRAAAVAPLLDSLALDEQSFLLSAAYTSGKNVFKGQVIMANYEVEARVGSVSGSVDVDSTVIQVGMDHNFTQQTKAFAQLGMSTTEVDSDDIDRNVLTVGMQTKF